MNPGISFKDYISRAVSSADVGPSNPAELRIFAEGPSGGTEIIDIFEMQDPRPNGVARVKRGTNTTFAFELIFSSSTVTPNPWDGALAMTVGSFALMNHNLAIDAPQDVRLEILGKNEAGTTAVHTEDLTIPYNTGAGSSIYTNREFSNANYQTPLSQLYTEVVYIKISFLNLPAAFEMDIGRMWVGNYLEACFEPNYGFGHTGNTGVNYSKNLDAHPFGSRHQKYMNFPAIFMREDDVYVSHMNYLDFSNTCVKGSEVLVMPRVATDAELMALSIYGGLTDDVYCQRTSGVTWTTSLSIDQYT